MIEMNMINAVLKTPALSSWTEKANFFGARKLPFVFLIDFEAGNAEIFTFHEALEKGIRWSFPDGHRSVPVPQHPPAIQLEKYPISLEEYDQKFQQVMSALQYGDSFLTNLTVSTPIKTNLGLLDIYRFANAPFKVYWPDKFVVFSPERFVKIQSGKIYTYPMKGTIKDEKGAEQLLSNIKEQEEKATVVDLMRNDLAMNSRDVQVERFRYAEAIQTDRGKIWQTSSKISGRLPSFFHEKIGSIIASMLPAGSISGAPKKRTVEIIQESEGEPRGWYTGVCGYYDGADLDSAVMIRFIEKTDKGLVFRSGGGITAKSTADQEYQEMIDKIYVPVY